MKIKSFIKRSVDEIGPVLAGFQIAVSIVGFFGIGAVANWILENWLPFTRWAWTEIFSFLHLPNISIEEKDSLTTLAFFAPMAVSSVYAWMTTADQTQDDAVNDAAAGREIRLRIYASLIGAAFMVIVGGRVINDAVTLFTTNVPVVEEVATTVEPDAKPLLDVELFASLGLFLSVFISILVMTAFVYWLSRRNIKIAELFDLFFYKISKNARPIRKVVSKASIAIAGNVLSMLASLMSFGTMFGGIAFAAGQLGVIRAASPMLVLISILATVFLNPKRLLQTAGVVIAFVLASVGWDVALWVVHAVEEAPKN